MNSDRKRKLASYLLLTGTAASGIVNGAASNTILVFLDFLFSRNKFVNKAPGFNTNRP